MVRLGQLRAACDHRTVVLLGLRHVAGACVQRDQVDVRLQQRRVARQRVFVQVNRLGIFGASGEIQAAVQERRCVVAHGGESLRIRVGWHRPAGETLLLPGDGGARRRQVAGLALHLRERIVRGAERRHQCDGSLELRARRRHVAGGDGNPAEPVARSRLGIGHGDGDSYARARLGQPPGLEQRVGMTQAEQGRRRQSGGLAEVLGGQVVVAHTGGQRAGERPPIDVAWRQASGLGIGLRGEFVLLPRVQHEAELPDRGRVVRAAQGGIARGANLGAGVSRIAVDGNGSPVGRRGCSVRADASIRAARRTEGTRALQHIAER